MEYPGRGRRADEEKLGGIEDEGKRTPMEKDQDREKEQKDKGKRGWFGFGR